MNNGDKNRWMDRAACKGKDPNLFFPPTGTGARKDSRVTQRALAICADCPVRQECLDYANGQAACEYGVFGGMTANDRADYREKHKIVFPRACLQCDEMFTPPAGAPIHLTHCSSECKRLHDLALRVTRGAQRRADRAAA